MGLCLPKPSVLLNMLTKKIIGYGKQEYYDVVRLRHRTGWSFLNIYNENPPLWNSKTDQIKYLHFKCIILSILSIFSNILLIPKYCDFLLKLISNIEYYFFFLSKK